MVSEGLPGGRGVRPASARLATAGDVAAASSLRADALAEIAALRGGSVYTSREVRPLPDAGDPSRPLWVGVLEDAVVGYLAAHVDPLDAGRLGVVDAVYVDRACRAVGVGEAMMAEAVAWCRGQGCLGIDAFALPGARATKNFFEESGFSSRLLVMHHRL